MVKFDCKSNATVCRSIADSLKAGIPVKAESFDQVTIFYSDIVDFTLLASNSSPMEVILKKYLSLQLSWSLSQLGAS